MNDTYRLTFDLTQEVGAKQSEVVKQIRKRLTAGNRLGFITDTIDVLTADLAVVCETFSEYDYKVETGVGVSKITFTLPSVKEKVQADMRKLKELENYYGFSVDDD